MEKVSVLLPVRNGEKYISQSVDSILNQTFSDFELLIFDDHSSDFTLEILREYTDERIKLYACEDGFIANLNKGIDFAKGSYIARMDADDIMLPKRLEMQFKIMVEKDVDVCISWMITFGEGIEPFIKHGFTGLVTTPLPWMIYHNFVSHPTVMMRKEFLIKNGLRYENYPHAEDYKLWVEIAKRNGVFYVEPAPLLCYRTSADQVLTVHYDEILQTSELIQREIIDYLLKE